MASITGTVVHTTIRNAGQPIADRETFDTAGRTLWGSYAGDGNIDCTGKLSEEHQTELRNAYAHHGHNLYIVWSYFTPIAWGTHGHELYIPAAKYSVTTSKHQSIVRRANV